MTWNWKWFRAAALVAFLTLNAGCSGIHAQKSISILDLLLPGVTKHAPVEQEELESVRTLRGELAAR